MGIQLNDTVERVVNSHRRRRRRGAVFFFFEQLFITKIKAQWAKTVTTGEKFDGKLKS